MEWVETTGRSVDEAKNTALDQLGVAEDDAEIIILDEPRPGLFGRVRGEARVRVRVRPTQPRAKPERRDRKKKVDDDADTAGAVSGAGSGAGIADEFATMPTASDAMSPAGKPKRSGGRSASRKATAAVSSSDPAADPPTEAAGGDSGDAFATAFGDRVASSPSVGTEPARAGRARSAKQGPNRNAKEGSTVDPSQQSEESTVDAQQVGDEAQRFMQGLVEAFGLSGTVSVHRDADDIEVNVDGSDLGLLVGPRGTTLQAVQELTRVAAQRRLGDHETRLRVDVGGYRERRREALGRFAHQVADQVIAEGVAKRLEPMSSADRKVIHDVLSEVDGVATRSEGDDPQRCVVIVPAGA